MLAELICLFLPSSGLRLSCCSSASSSNQPVSTVQTSFPLWTEWSLLQGRCCCWWPHTAGSELYVSQPVYNNSVKQWDITKCDRNYSTVIRNLYLLCIRMWFFMPRRCRVVSSKTRGTKVLYLAKVSQYGAGGTIHPIKAVTGVWLPTGP